MILSLLLPLVGCAPSDSTFTSEPDAPPVDVGTGSVAGRVCDTDGVDWLENALIYSNLVDNTGRFYDLRSTLTDADGRWVLEDMPAGYNNLIYVQKGDEIIDYLEVDVFKNERTELPEPDCFDTKIQEVAVITGDFDDFSLVLDSLGIDSYELINGKIGDELMDFLLNPEEMSQFDMIVFNGGHIEQGVIYDVENPSNAVPAEIRSNIMNYVAAGGSVYATDWAYDVVEQIWPDRVDFLGTDQVPAEFLGEDRMPIQYDLPVWPLIEKADELTSIHLLGNPIYRWQDTEYTLSSSPLLISFSGGGGKVIYSSFRYSANLDDQMNKLMQYIMFEL